MGREGAEVGPIVGVRQLLHRRRIDGGLIGLDVDLERRTTGRYRPPRRVQQKAWDALALKGNSGVEGKARIDPPPARANGSVERGPEGIDLRRVEATRRLCPFAGDDHRVEFARPD